MEQLSSSYSGARLMKLQWIFFIFCTSSDKELLLMLETLSHLRCMSFSRKYQEVLKRLDEICPHLNSGPAAFHKTSTPYTKCISIILIIYLRKCPARLPHFKERHNSKKCSPDTQNTIPAPCSLLLSHSSQPSQPHA